MNAAVQVIPRSFGLGASDAAAAVGLSKWRTTVDLYLEKTGQVNPDFDSEALHLAMGKALEPVVVELFEKRTGLKVTSRQKQIVDPTWGRRWVTLDGEVSDDGSLEAKTTGYANPKEWGDEYEDDAIPMDYYIQTQHSMACTGKRHVWVPVLILNRQFRIYRVLRDEDVIARLTASERHFMELVDARTPPPPQSLDDVSALWPQDDGNAVIATPELIEVAGQLKALKAEIKAAEGRADELALQIKSSLGERALLLSPKGLPICTWKTAKPSRVLDTARFRAEKPAIYAEYEIERAGSRRLLLK